MYALISGLIAGYALAIPLGAIAVLLIREGVIRGFARGWIAAAGASTVDIIYSTLAITIGAIAAPIIVAISPWPGVIGGLVLICIAVIGLVNGFKSNEASGETKTYNKGAIDKAGMFQRYSTFVGLTALNPATLLYFAAIMAGLTQIITNFWDALAFVVGVGAATFSWALVLVATGAVLRMRASVRAQHITVLVGNIIIALLGITLIVAAFAGAFN